MKEAQNQKETLHHRIKYPEPEIRAKETHLALESEPVKEINPESKIRAKRLKRTSGRNTVLVLKSEPSLPRPKKTQNQPIPEQETQTNP